MKSIYQGLAFAFAAASFVACSPSEPGDLDGDDSDTLSNAIDTSPGVNGSACAFSDYNCKLREEGGNRVTHTDGTIDWGVDDNVAVLDGNGDVLGVNTYGSLRFNYGQRRRFHGDDYVFAMATSNGSSGWFPLASVKSSDVLISRLGNVKAHRSGLAPMACYEIRSSSDPTLQVKKVVFDTDSPAGPSGDAAGDYLPKIRANGKPSMNLDFNLPGSALGGPAIDHFPSGTKFQRVSVPTDSGPPSIDVKLWSDDGKGHFKKAAGAMKFIYGYVTTATSEVRVGWMALDGLEPSTGCK
jgi:hypothetical protein